MGARLQLRVKQWQLLRQLTRGEQSVGDLAEALARKHGPVTTALGTLEQKGLVEVVEISQRSGPGQPRGRWRLTQVGEALIASSAAPPPEVPPPGPVGHTGETDQDEVRATSWPLERHQSYLSTEVSEGSLPKLLEVLAAGQEAVEATFVARLDGRPQNYLFVFDERLGARPAEVLASALDAANLSTTVGTIGEVRSVDDLIGDARAASAAATAVKIRLDESE